MSFIPKHCDELLDAPLFRLMILLAIVQRPPTLLIPITTAPTPLDSFF